MATSKIPCVHNGDSIGDDEFNSYVSCFLTLRKKNSILVLFCPITLVGDEWEDGRLHLGPNFSMFISPTHNRCHRLLWALCTLKVYYNPLWGPLRPLVGIIAHLVVSDLLIYPFSLREPTHAREIIEPITKDTLYTSLVCSIIYHVFS